MAAIELHPGAEQAPSGGGRVVRPASRSRGRTHGGDHPRPPADRRLARALPDPLRKGAAQRRIRRYIMGDFPYVLPYLVRDETIFVLAVAHTSRKPRYWEKRVT